MNEAQLIECLYKERLSRKDNLLLILCVQVNQPKKVLEIKRIGRQAGLTTISKWNVSDTLSNAKGYAIRLPEGWSITQHGRDYISKLGIVPSKISPKVIHFSKSLRSLLGNITNTDANTFIEEAINSYEAGYLRSAVVLSWAGAVSLLQDQIYPNKLDLFNDEAKRRFSDWKPAKSKDDLSRLKEADFLDLIGSPPVSIIGKNVKEELKNNCLQLRNGCGHPNSLLIGENRVASHLEILILNVFSKFC